MKIMHLISFILFCAPLFGQEGGVEVRYVANEGVYISGGGQSVLIDAIHKYYGDDYLYPEPGQLEQMINGDAPYTSVDLLLISHVHGDHFHASSVVDFLRGHSETYLISSAQVLDSLNLYAESGIRSRLSLADHRQNRITTFDQAGIDLHVLGIRHASKRFKWVQNLGHLFTLNGIKLLHVGDASLDLKRFEGLNLPGENIDIAIIPYWFIYDRDKMDELINAEMYVLTHLSPREDHSDRKEESQYPDVRLFIESGETLKY